MKRRLLLIIKHILGIDTRSNFERALENGLTVGENINIQDDVKFDLSHCWLISLGNDVTITPMLLYLHMMQALKGHWDTRKLAKQ